MIFESIHIKGPLLIEPKVFGDHRGYFLESYSRDLFRRNGIDQEFVQDNQSLSNRGILRGLHYQEPPFAQGKLVRVIRGSVLDVIVDIRKNSETYGEHYSVELSGDNFKMLWIPEGFAHGFLTLEDETIFSYKCTGFYAPSSEGGLPWNDPYFNIQWGENQPILSEKDKHYPSFNTFQTPFI